jgi:hypothetical protein
MSGPIVKWYATKWCDTPERKEFIRETEHMLFRRDFRRVRRERKVSKWGRYYDTYEEAQAAIDAFKAGKAADLARRRLTEAAPELLEALELVMDRLVDRHETDEAAVRARAAIAKATGEQS